VAIDRTGRLDAQSWDPQDLSQPRLRLLAELAFLVALRVSGFRGIDTRLERLAGTEQPHADAVAFDRVAVHRNESRTGDEGRGEKLQHALFRRETSARCTWVLPSIRISMKRFKLLGCELEERSRSTSSLFTADETE
jgi:hypothetical protein